MIFLWGIIFWRDWQKGWQELLGCAAMGTALPFRQGPVRSGFMRSIVPRAAEIT